MSKPRLVASVMLLAALTTGCSTFDQSMNDHWSAMSIPARANRYFTGYDGQKHDGFINYLGGNASDMSLFFQRHFLNHNPRNPFQSGRTANFHPPSNPNGNREFEVSEQYKRRQGRE